MPGFIDPHTHHDEALLTDPLIPSMVSQGVTTLINGNCGVSIAPLTTDRALPAPFSAIIDGERERFASFADYFARLDTDPQATRVIVTWSRDYPDAAGRDLADVAAEWGCDLDAAIARLIPALGIFFIMDEADVRRILAYEHTMVCSDAIATGPHPHPRAWGTFPRVLGHYARDVGLFSLETAVAKMTGLPAARFGLEGRGAIREGAFADLVLFDPERIEDAATYDDPIQPARGLDAVYVNGRCAWKDGASTGERSGRVLRKAA